MNSLALVESNSAQDQDLVLLRIQNPPAEHSSAGDQCSVFQLLVLLLWLIGVTQVITAAEQSVHHQMAPGILSSLVSSDSLVNDKFCDWFRKPKLWS